MAEDVRMALTSGISGLDAILLGGFQAGRTMLVSGGPGSGKTALGMQFLAAGAGCDEPGLMVSFEESPEKLLANFAPMRFPFAIAAKKMIHMVDGRPLDDIMTIGEFDLQGLIATLTSIVRRYGVKRIVIDAIDGLLILSDDYSRVRNEMLRLLNWLNDSGLTAILTIKVSDRSDAFADRYDFAEFAVDGVLHLRSAIYGKLLQRTVRIVKRRGAPFVTGEHPYNISEHGIRVMYSPMRTIAADSGHDERYSTGVERLDRMLGGGFLRGSTALISGIPGASKTTFSAAFLAAGCALGERGLFIGFDEPAEQMVRNMRSVGIDLAQYQKAGLLRCESFAAGAAIADDFLLLIEDLIGEHRPVRVVVDPISAMSKAGGGDITESAVERLGVILKLHGATTVFTALSEHGAVTFERSASRISTVADTWIHLNFAEHGGERNRTLTIVKSRGTGHSAQTREVLLEDGGITLSDVYSADGTVLFGTARLEREQRLRTARTEERQSMARELRRLDEEHSALSVRADQLARQLEQLVERRNELAENAAVAERAINADAAAVQARRWADPVRADAGMGTDNG